MKNFYANLSGDLNYIKKQNKVIFFYKIYNFSVVVVHRTGYTKTNLGNVR